MLLPPSDVKAESAVLGAAMIPGDAYKWLVQNMTPEMFYLDSNRVIVRAIIELANSGIEPDQVNVNSRLIETNKMAEAGGYQALVAAVNDAVIDSHIEHYGQSVMRSYYCRQAMSASQTVADAISRGDLEARDMAFDDMAKAIEARNRIDQIKSVNGYDAMMEVMRDLDNREANDYVPLGINGLDSLIGGVKRGHLTTFGARPRIGKTATLTQILYSMGLRGLRVACFMCEMSSKEVAQRAASSYSDIKHSRITRKRVSGQEMADLNSMAGDIAERTRSTLFFNPLGSPTIRDIRTFSEQCQADVVVIDYLTRCKLPPNRDNRLRVNEFMVDLKNMAKDGNKIVLLGAQVNRNADRETDRAPLLSDLKESSAIEEESDAVFLLHSKREDLDSQEPTIDLQYHLAKNRHGPMGKVVLQFHRHLARIGDAPSKQAEPKQRDFQKAAAGDEEEF